MLLSPTNKIAAQIQFSKILYKLKRYITGIFQNMMSQSLERQFQLNVSELEFYRLSFRLENILLIF